MISKELLQEILGLKIYSVKLCSWSKFLRYDFDAIGERRDSSINIYELAHKCKEWARNKSYQISACKPIVQDDTGAQVINYWYKVYITKFDIGSYDSPYQILFDINEKSEPEAIFKACEWILNKTKEIK